MPSLELSSAAIVQEMDQAISERVAVLKSEHDKLPTLAIVSNNPAHLPSQKYIELKGRIAQRVGMAAWTNVGPELAVVTRSIERFNDNPAVDGIIVQLPLREQAGTDEVLAQLNPLKDVDGLGQRPVFDPATPSSILDLLEAYRLGYREQSVAILGQGRLVGHPLLRMMRERGALHVQGYDVHSTHEAKRAGLNDADIIISATGCPGLLTPRDFDSAKPRVLIDAGVAEQGGVVSGDVSDELRVFAGEHGWAITPKFGGIGPLTVRHLLLNTVIAAERSVTPQAA